MHVFTHVRTYYEYGSDAVGPPGTPYMNNRVLTLYEISAFSACA